MIPTLLKTARPKPATPTATRWYRVQCGGFEPIEYPDGTVNQEIVIDGFSLELPDTYLGLGSRELIEAAALRRFPDKQLIDFWPLSSPPSEEF
jgi:hypothetical protein